MAGLAALCAVALAAGLFDDAPSGRLRGLAIPAAVAASGRVPALPPGLRLCFHGPGGELIGFAPTVEGRAPADADAGTHGAGTP